MRRIFILLFAVLHFSMFYSAESYYFTLINGNAGLSQNQVKAITQDSYGFVWIGTKNKLNRYDGINFKIYDCYDKELKKGNNNISALCEDNRKNLWVGTDEGVYIYNPITEQFKSFDKSTSSGEKIIQWISDIKIDADNNIWIIAPNQGVFKYNQNRDELDLFTVVEKLDPSNSSPQCLAIEKNGRVWVGTIGSGAYLYIKSENRFEQYLGDRDGKNSLKGQYIFAMSHYEDKLIIGIHEGKLLRLDKRLNTLSDALIQDANNKIIRSLNVMNDEEIWVGTEDGLYIFNEKKMTKNHIFHDPKNPYSLSDNFVSCVFKDIEGGVWIGTRFGGVSYLPKRNTIFEKFIPTSSQNSISSKKIREIREHKDGNIWIGTEDAGVDIYNPENQTFKKAKNLTSGKTLAILLQEHEAKIGYFKNGIDNVSSVSGSLIKHFSKENLGLDEGSIYSLCEDRFGNIWLGNAWGINKAEKGSMNFKWMEQFGTFYSFDIMEDSDGLIWVATMGSGVYQYDQIKDKLIHFSANGSENSLSTNSVSSITEDHLGRIWFSTDRGGICVYDKRTSTFKNYTMKDGLPDDVSYKILEDNSFNLWFGTDKGLVRFNPDTKNIRVYSQKDGLLSNQFNYKSGLKSSRGKLYFGSSEGMIAFNPDEFSHNQYIPPVYITKLTINNQEVNLLSDIYRLENSISHTEKIILKHNQSTLSFDFVALSYSAPLANVYMYKMENIDDDWVTTTNNRSASYAKLPPGRYTFRVKGANNDGIWNEQGASIIIDILPAWWASKFAYFIYMLFFSFFIYYLIRYYLNKHEKRNEEKQRLFEIEKEKELYELKTDFFINIAHEIRTPVTLISGPLESILETPLQDEELKRNISIIERNTNHLLGLTNQLLDFRKVDKKKLSLHFRETDIIALFEEIKSRYTESLNAGNKQLEIEISLQPIIANVDRDALSKILNNLFSNALKYSDKRIRVELIDADESFQFIFSNDGELIPIALKEKIFDPFFQVHANNVGSGIGLSLAHSLAELHSGRLEYSSEKGLNTFTLFIPKQIEEEVEDVDEISEEVKDEFIVERMEESSFESKTVETILVVEDNLEMLDFISKKLKEDFAVEKAENGKKAIEILESKQIDIVISDLMMPMVDGFELCQYIKSNVEYSHIIVIFLTAKNDLGSKIKGLELGADAFVEKPFSFHYLLTLINSLVNNNKRVKELFIQKPFLPIQQVGLNKADEQFLNKTIEVINENITDPNFNVEQLSELMFMSRSNLHRKLKHLLDMTPTNYIRLVRLKKSAQLIKEEGLRSNEVCYLVGISSPAYFTKIFHKQFGLTPKEFESMSNNKAE